MCRDAGLPLPSLPLPPAGRRNQSDVEQCLLQGAGDRRASWHSFFLAVFEMGAWVSVWIREWAATGNGPDKASCWPEGLM